MGTGRVVVGVDISKGAWVAVTLRDGRFETAVRVSHVQSVAASAEAAVIGVDIPVGLPAFEQRRLADRLARARIGRRGRRCSRRHRPSNSTPKATSQL